jgi:hypothetical protein
MSSSNCLRTLRLFTAIAVALLPLPVVVAAADDPPPLPTYGIGYVWPLRDSAYELVRLQDDAYVFASPDAEIRLTKSLRLAGIRRGDEFLQVTIGPELRWPLRVGDWGVSPSDWRASRRPPTPWGRQLWGMTARRLTWSAEGWDEITIGPKRIRALRIVYQMIADSLAAPHVLEWEISAWYAPEAGVFVRAVDRSFDIVNLELAPSADLIGLRVRAGVPGPPRAATSPDAVRRHRSAARETCGGLKCVPPASRPLID